MAARVNPSSPPTGPSTIVAASASPLAGEPPGTGSGCCCRSVSTQASSCVADAEPSSVSDAFDTASGSGSFGLYKDMTATEYQDRFDDFYADGVYPQRFVAYETPAGERYAASWEAVSGDWAHYYDMTGAQYQQRYDDFAAQGLRLHHLQAYGDRYSAIWTRP
jgi:hypothetical protein